MLATICVVILAARVARAAEPGGAQGSYSEASRFTQHKGPVHALALSRDGRYVATAGEDRMCYVLDVKTWKPARRLGPHRAALRTVAFATSGSVVVGGQRDPTSGQSVFIWDPRASRIVAQWNSAENGVMAVAIASDDQRLVAARADGGFSLWFLKSNETEEVQGGAGKQELRTAVAFGPDGKVFVIGGSNGRIYRWVIGDQRRQRSRTGLTPASNAGVLALAYSADGQTFASGHTDGGVRYWLDKGCKRLGEWTGHTGNVRSVSISPDGKYVASAGSDKTIRVWEVATGTAAWQILGHAGEVTSVQFVGSHEQVASASLDGTVRLWRLTGAATAKTADAGRNTPDIARKAKLLVPTTDQIAAASKLIREVFRDDFAAANEPAAKETLAKKLTEQGQAEENSPAERYAALDAARQLAIDAGSVPGAIDAADEVAGWFKVDPLKLRVDTVKSLVRTVRTVGARGQLAEAAIDLVEKSAAADRYDDAADLAKTADNLAKAARKTDVQRRLRSLETHIKNGRAQWESYQQASEKLKTSPDDAAANLAVGKHLLFNRGNWPQGLAHLAKGSDEALARVAKQDLAAPEDADKQADLADAWHALGETLSGNERLAAQTAADHWYRQAVGQLAGLRKLKVQKSLEKLGTLEQVPDYLRR